MLRIKLDMTPRIKDGHNFLSHFATIAQDGKRQQSILMEEEVEKGKSQGFVLDGINPMAETDEFRDNSKTPKHLADMAVNVIKQSKYLR